MSMSVFYLFGRGEELTPRLGIGFAVARRNGFYVYSLGGTREWGTCQHTGQGRRTMTWDSGVERDGGRERWRVSASGLSLIK